MEYQISIKALKAIALFVAKKDIRYYLTGVHVSTNAGTLRLEASDGHTLATYSASAGNDESYDLIIPLPIVEMVLKNTRGGDTVTLDAVSCVLGNVKFTPLDGTFPQCSRVWDSTPKNGEEGKPCLIDPEYYARLGKVRKAMGVKPDGLRLWYTGNALWWQVAEVRGLIMALRVDCNEGSRPAY